MVFFGLWGERVVLPVFLAVVYVVVIYSHFCVRFFSFSLFLILCALMLVKLCLAASRDFLLNKKRAQTRSRKKIT